jgi:ubiquinone/menaquinone biosynthesis C-methylase UbiE
MTQHPHFEAWENEHRHVRWTEARDIPAIRSRLPEHSTILDLGCGKGRYSLPLAREHELYAVDIARTALESLRDKTVLHILHASATCLPFRDGCFDAVICTGVLQHLLEQERRDAAGETERVLRPGGLLFFEAFGREDFRYGGEETEPHTFVRGSGIIYHYFTLEELRDLFPGFEFVDVGETKREKLFHGKRYIRHSISFVGERAGIPEH